MNKDEVMISVIVPVYNVEKYLVRCIESILAQTYKDFELLLVDDGSPDQCGVICDEYAEKYSNIKVIHQTNQGLSAARNNAVPKSVGQYITFIDSDDYVTSDYLEYLMYLIQEYHSDIAAGGLFYQYESRSPIIVNSKPYSVFYSVDEALMKMNYGLGFSVFAWGKLYKRELIENHPYPVGKLYEDLFTTYKIVCDSNGVAFGNRKIYYWVQRTDSIMHSSFNRRQFDGIKAAKQQLIYLSKTHPKAIPAAKYRYTAKAVELAALNFTSGSDKKVFDILKRNMIHYYRDVLKDPNAKKSMKLRIIAMRMGFYPAKFIFAIHDRIKMKRLKGEEQ